MKAVVSAERTVEFTLWQNVGGHSDRILLELWQQIVLDGLDQVVFFDKPFSLVDFAELANSGSLFVLTCPELCGCAWLSDTVPNSNVTISLCLFKNFHRQGIGREVFTQLIDAIFVEGIQTIIAKGLSTNKAAIGLVTSLGFDVVGHIPIGQHLVTIAALTRDGWRLYNGR